MADLTNDSDRLLSEGRALVRDNQSGGRHRRMPPIGEGSRRLRNRHRVGKVKRIVFAAAAILLGSSVLGLLVDGLGFAGLFSTLVVLIIAILLFTRYPKIKVPQRSELNRGDVRQMVARTELWLENQRPALPPPAVALVDQIGTQLDALGLQLEMIDPAHPAAQETRKLVGEHLPEMVDAYRRIPAHLRNEKRAGATPDEQLVESLGKISGEIDQVTRKLAEGSLDDLAIRTRYLGYRYGEAGEPVSENN